MPSGISAALPSGISPALRSGIPPALPSGIPTGLPPENFACESCSQPRSTFDVAYSYCTMGNTASRPILDALSASENAGKGLGQILEDPEFIQVCQRNSQGLSTVARTNLRQVTGDYENPVVQRVLQLTQDKIQSPGRIATDEQPPSLCEVYKMLARRQKSGVRRKRIQAVALYTISDQLGDSDPCDNMRTYLPNDLNDDRHLLTVGKLKVILRSGRRFKYIAESCGGLGALLMIPDSTLNIRQAGRDLTINGIEPCIGHLKELGIAEKAQNASAHDHAKEIYENVMQGFEAELKTRRPADIEDDDCREHSSSKKDGSGYKGHMEGHPDSGKYGDEHRNVETLKNGDTVKARSDTERTSQDTNAPAPPQSHPEGFPATTYSHRANISGYGNTMEGYQSVPGECQPHPMPFAFGPVQTGSDDPGVHPSLSGYQAPYPTSTSESGTKIYHDLFPLHNPYHPPDIYEDRPQIMQPITSQFDFHPPFPGLY